MEEKPPWKLKKASLSLLEWKKMKKKKCGVSILLGEKRIRCLYSVGRLGLKVGVKGLNCP